LVRGGLIVGAVVVAAALVAWVVLAKPFQHRPVKTVVATLASSEPKVPVASPRPTFAHYESPRPAASVAHRALVAVVTKTPTPTPTPAAATAKPVPPPPPPKPEKTVTPAAPAVVIDNFAQVRVLPRRVCIQYKVENVTLIEITNEGTGATVYTRNLDVANGRVAENPVPICLRRGTGSNEIQYELQASGPGGEVVKTMVVEPGPRGKKRFASP
jgi:hypothetical protein